MSREDSERARFGESGGGFFLRSGDGFARDDGDGDGGFFGSGDGVLTVVESVDLCGVCASGSEILSGAESGGVLTETKPGMVKKKKKLRSEEKGREESFL